MPLSQKIFAFRESYTSREGRFKIASEPAIWPSGVQLVPPSVVCQSPRLATPAMILSSPGNTERRQRLPHSDGIPARFPVTLIHSPNAEARESDIVAIVRKS